MKFSVKTWIMVVLLQAAIGYTVYNCVIGEIDTNTAVMYILVLCFPYGQKAFCVRAEHEGCQSVNEI